MKTTPDEYLINVLAGDTGELIMLMENKLTPKQTSICKKYIGDQIKRESLKGQTVENICYASMRLNFYSENSLTVFQKILNKKFSYLVKLAILDYVLFFFSKIDDTSYAFINERVRFSRNPFTKFQFYMNMSLLKPTFTFKVIFMLEKQLYPTLFYRFFNSIESQSKLAPVFVDQKEKLINIISLSNFSKDVKDDLLNINNNIW